MRSLKEMIGVIDSKKEERKQAQKKLACEVDFVDLEARNLFATGKVTTSIMKCASRFNHCGLRHPIINDNLVEVHYSQCNQVEMQDYVVRCGERVELQKEFTCELLIEMLKAKDNKVCIDAIMAFGEDILWQLECEEDEEECETSQWMIGIKELFRGCIVKAQTGVDMNYDKHRKLNKIVVRERVEYYAKCQKHKNEAGHNA